MSLYQSQKTVKPKIEDVAGDFIPQKHLNSLMELVTFFKENKLTPRWASGNSWTVRFKNKNVCFVKIIGTSWFVLFSDFTREKWFVGYDAYFTDELKQFVWENIKGAYCPKACKGKKRLIFGKEFNDICACWAVRSKNPDGITLEHSKKVILAIKDFITDLTAASNT